MRWNATVLLQVSYIYSLNQTHHECPKIDKFCILLRDHFLLLGLHQACNEAGSKPFQIKTENGEMIPAAIHPTNKYAGDKTHWTLLDRCKFHLDYIGTHSNCKETYGLIKKDFHKFLDEILPDTSETQHKHPTVRGRFYFAFHNYFAAVHGLKLKTIHFTSHLLERQSCLYDQVVLEIGETLTVYTEIQQKALLNTLVQLNTAVRYPYDASKDPPSLTPHAHSHANDHHITTDPHAPAHKDPSTQAHTQHPPATHPTHPTPPHPPTTHPHTTATNPPTTPPYQYPPITQQYTNPQTTQ